MKNVITSVAIAATLAFALPTLADQKSDNALLTDCKNSISDYHFVYRQSLSHPHRPASRPGPGRSH